MSPVQKLVLLKLAREPSFASELSYQLSLSRSSVVYALRALKKLRMAEQIARNQAVWWQATDIGLAKAKALIPERGDGETRDR